MLTKTITKVVCLFIVVSSMLLLSAVLLNAQEKVVIRVGAGPPGTGKDLALQFPSEAIRRGNPGWVVDVINGPTAIADIASIGRGMLDMTRSEAPEIYNIAKGYYGTKKLPEPVDLRWLAPSVVYNWQFFIREDLPFNSMVELIKMKYPLKFTMGRKGTGPYNNALLVLDAYGIKAEDILSWGGKIQYQGSNRAADLLADGIIDAIMLPGEVPNPPVAQLSRKRKLKVDFVSEPDVQAKLKAKGFVIAKIPAGSYSFVKEDALTMGMPCVIIVNARMKDDVAYNITRAIWEQREKFLFEIHPIFKTYLQPEIVTSWGEQFGDILHPGAAKYYKEQGLLN